MKNLVLGLISAVLLTTSLNISAHLNVVAESVFSAGEEPRDYLEGKNVYINVNAVEGCKDATGNKYDTTDLVVVMPNSLGALSDNFFMKSKSGEYDANAVMFTRARISNNWTKVDVVKGPVDPYYKDRKEGVRAIKWLGGNISPDQYDNLEFRAKLPNIKSASCVGKLRVELPTISYCKDGFVRAWIGTEGSSLFPADSDKLQLEEKYELYFNVTRDVENNPYPEHCERDAEGDVIPVEEVVRPSDADIDIYGVR
ncbi:MAG: DUF1775 domain-containing protein [Methylococcales bacterium]|nr:DUF1775 domain-containing protein [Methylococcales bacterium]